MPLYLAAWTIVTASYLEFLSTIFTNYRVSRMQLHALYSRRADLNLSYHTSAHVITLAACKISHSF